MEFSDEQINKMLAGELGQLGTTTGSVAGGGFSAAASKAGAEGGTFGAKFAAKFLRTKRFEATATFSNHQEAVEVVKRYFGNNPENIASGLRFTKMTGSGVKDLNPTLLVAFMKENDPTVWLKGYAKEGIIDQHSAKKAVQRCLKAIEK